MASIELNFDQNEERLKVHPFQSELVAQEELVFQNKLAEDLLLTFEPCHPFLLIGKSVSLPPGATARFQPAEEIHFNYEAVFKESKPRPRSAIITILQPKGGVSQDRSDQYGKPCHANPVAEIAIAAIAFRQKGQDLIIDPPLIDVKLGEVLGWENQTKQTLNLTFQPVALLADGNEPILVPSFKDVRLPIVSKLRFDFTVSFEDEPGKDELKGTYRLSF